MASTPTSTPPASGSEPPAAPPARLTRSRDDRMIAGVAGGLARHLGVDPVIIRIAFVALALVGGGGAIAYLIAWIVIPEEPVDAATARPEAAASGSRLEGSTLGGLILVALGGMLLLHQFVPVLSWRYVAPAVLIVLGAVLLLSQRTRS